MSRPRPEPEVEGTLVLVVRDADREGIADLVGEMLLSVVCEQAGVTGVRDAEVRAGP